MKDLLKKFLETKDKTVIIGIACLTVVEVIALLKGINGVVLTMVVGIIAAAIGISVPTPKFMQR